MPRKPRMYLPDVPCHVIQRGNNREASFFYNPGLSVLSGMLVMRRQGKFS